jgi:hypothetical protein
VPLFAFQIVHPEIGYRQLKFMDCPTTPIAIDEATRRAEAIRKGNLKGGRLELLDEVGQVLLSLNLVSEK